MTPAATPGRTALMARLDRAYAQGFTIRWDQYTDTWEVRRGLELVSEWDTEADAAEAAELYAREAAEEELEEAREAVRATLADLIDDADAATVARVRDALDRASHA